MPDIISSVIYNGVTIAQVDFQEINSENIYDDGDITAQYTRTTIRLTGIITPDFSGLLATKMALDEVGQELTVIVGGVTLYHIINSDDLLGPKPRRTVITEITGSAFALVSWTVEIAQNQPEPAADEDGTTTLLNVIAHRYSVKHSLNEEFLTTRTISGMVRVRGNAGVANPDLLRGFVTPGLPVGFRRKTEEFLVQADGLVLRYNVVDEEWAGPILPSPAIDGSATFTVRYGNMIWYNDCVVKLRGHKLSSKLDMFRAALAIVRQRMSVEVSSKEWLVDGSLEENLYANEITLHLTTQASSSALGNADGFFPAGTKIFGPMAAGEEFDNLGPYGSAMIAAAVQAFFVPVTYPGAAGNPADTTQASAAPTVSSAIVPEIPTGTLSESGSDILSADHKTAAYLAYDDTIRTVIDNGVVCLPSTVSTIPATVYQMHNPYAVVEQTGRATRVGAPVQVPVPAYRGGLNGASSGSGNATDTTIMDICDVETAAPQVMPDKGQRRYSARWHYRMYMPISKLATGTSGLQGVDPTYDMDVPGNAALLPDIGPSAAITMPPSGGGIG